MRGRFSAGILIILIYTQYESITESEETDVNSLKYALLYLFLPGHIARPFLLSAITEESRFCSSLSWQNEFCVILLGSAMMTMIEDVMEEHVNFESKAVFTRNLFRLTHDSAESETYRHLADVFMRG